jgi:hypothetical protein
MRRIVLLVTMLLAASLGVAPGAAALGTGAIIGSVTDPSGAAVDGAVVSVYAPFVSTPVGTATTTGGTYTVSGLAPGNYVVQVAPPASRQDLGFVFFGGLVSLVDANATLVAGPADLVAVADGATAVADVSLPHGGRIAGRVTRADGSPAAGARVQARFPDGTPVAGVTADAGGNYAIEHLPAWVGRVGAGTTSGAYRLVATPAFGDLALPTASPTDPSDPFVVGPASDLGVNLSLNRAIWGVGRLTRLGSPVAGSTFVTAAMCLAPSTYEGAGLACTPSGSLVERFVGGAAGLGDPGEVLLVPRAPGSYTIRGVDASQFPTVTLGPLVPGGLDLDYGDEFACTLPLDTVPPSCSVTPSSAPTVVPDPLDPTATVSLSATAGTAVSDVSVAGPAGTAALPGGLSLGSGVVSFTATVPTAGASATISISVEDPTEALAQAWKLIDGVWTDASPLGPTFAPDGSGRTTVTFTLTDNGFGDSDPTPGVIRDPIAFSAAPTSGFDFRGFRPPVHPAPTVNVVRAGSTVPVKWVLFDSAGAPVGDPSSFVSLTFRSAPCESGARSDAIEETTVSTSSLRYLGDGVWQSNWRTTRGVVGCGTLILELADGSTHDARFGLR